MEGLLGQLLGLADAGRLAEFGRAAVVDEAGSDVTYRAALGNELADVEEIPDAHVLVVARNMDGFVDHGDGDLRAAATGAVAVRERVVLVDVRLERRKIRERALPLALQLVLGRERRDQRDVVVDGDLVAAEVGPVVDVVVVAVGAVDDAPQMMWRLATGLLGSPQIEAWPAAWWGWLQYLFV